MSNETATLYEHEGCTPILNVVDEATLAPLQQLIYSKISHLLSEHSSDMPLVERLRLPFKAKTSAEDFSHFMRAIDGSQEVLDIIYHPSVRAAFELIFDSDQVEPFPISRFRAQFPSLSKSTYSWHQDEGTWYAVPVTTLAYKMPATLWLSINGADKTNSIEILPGSHHSKLENHYQVQGQGFFNADVPAHLRSVPTRIIETRPGQGVAFHPLTFHRSVVSEVDRPRFSIDIRYYKKVAQPAEYKVDWRFKMKRLYSSAKTVVTKNLSK